MKKIFSRTLIAFFLVAIPVFGNAQIISTLAGTGTATYSGDGGAATAAGLNRPDGIQYDTSGNLYISEANNHTIRKISLSGVITTICGTGSPGFSGDGGPATAATLRQPFSTVFDHAGNLYIGDGANHRIRKINTSGIISTIAGNGTPGFGGDGGQATAAQLDEPSGIVIDGAGNLLFADQQNNRIRKISTAGIMTTYAGTGTAGYSGDGGPASAAKLFHPNYLFLDALGNLYISDNANQRVRKVSGSGIITTIAGNGSATYGGDGGAATAASINYAGGITGDPFGNIYIADCYNHRLRMVSSSGMISTYAGTVTAGFSGDGGSATAAKLQNPVDVLFNHAGELIIADMGNHRVRRIGSPNHPPHFINSTHTLSVCKDSAAKSINTLLAISDSDAGQTVIWTIVTAPMHGSLSGFSAVSSSGALVTPGGLTYSSSSGYVGTDSFNIKVSDGIDNDNIMVHVTVSDCHLVVTGLNVSGNRMSISPNPTSGLFDIRIPGINSQFADVTITDAVGKKMLQTRISANTDATIQLSTASGIYFIIANTGDHIFYEKIILNN